MDSNERHQVGLEPVHPLETVSAKLEEIRDDIESLHPEDVEDVYNRHVRPWSENLKRHTDIPPPLSLLPLLHSPLSPEPVDSGRESASPYTAGLLYSEEDSTDRPADILEHNFSFDTINLYGRFHKINQWPDEPESSETVYLILSEWPDNTTDNEIELWSFENDSYSSIDIDLDPLQPGRFTNSVLQNTEFWEVEDEERELSFIDAEAFIKEEAEQSKRDSPNPPEEQSPPDSVRTEIGIREPRTPDHLDNSHQPDDPSFTSSFPPDTFHTLPQYATPDCTTYLPCLQRLRRFCALPTSIDIDNTFKNHFIYLDDVLIASTYPRLTNADNLESCTSDTPLTEHNLQSVEPYDPERPQIFESTPGPSQISQSELIASEQSDPRQKQKRPAKYIHTSPLPFSARKRLGLWNPENLTPPRDSEATDLRDHLGPLGINTRSFYSQDYVRLPDFIDSEESMYSDISD